MKTFLPQSTFRTPHSALRNPRAFRIPPAAVRIRGGRGFTLIELMVVIVIISILVALILPAINNARIKANEARVSNEISQLSTAITSFKAKYGVEPPSKISIYTTAAGWAGDAYSTSVIRGIWPQFDFTMGAGAGSAYPSYWPAVVNLNSGECLIFFLGGVQTAAGQPPNGFAKNPQYPFAPLSVVTNREGPFYEFTNIKQFTDIDGNGFNEWMDSLPSQTRPLLYFSAYDGQGYRLAELPMNSTSPPNAFGIYNSGSQVCDCLHDFYRASSTATAPPASPSWDSSTPPNVIASGSQLLAAQKPQTFQIISPGYDNEYGFGGVFDTSGTLPHNGLQQDAVTKRYPDADNLTNFNAGRLNP